MKKYKFRIASMLMLSIGLLLLNNNIARADGKYENAEQFYNNTDPSNAYRAEYHNGNVYYATCGKMASSSTNLLYTSLGFHVTVSGGGESVSFVVVKGGGILQEVDEDENLANGISSRREVNGFSYNLYYIPLKEIKRMVTLKGGSSVADTIFCQPEFEVYMSAIMTTKKNIFDTNGNDIGDDMYGGISDPENDGDISEWGKVYHLYDPIDLGTMQGIFSGHTFESFKYIEVPISG